MRKLLFFCLLNFVFISCVKDTEEDYKTKIFFVAEKKGTYTNWAGGTGLVMMVSEQLNGPYRPLPEGIEGFQYVEGFKYQLEVKEYKYLEPRWDASSVYYVLKRIISKQ